VLRQARCVRAPGARAAVVPPDRRSARSFYVAAAQAIQIAMANTTTPARYQFRAAPSVMGASYRVSLPLVAKKLYAHPPQGIVDLDQSLG
jgi:hypothetical protein